MRACRTLDYRGSDHVCGPGPRAVEDLGAGDPPRPGHRDPAGGTQLRRRPVQAALLLVLGLLILVGLLRSVHPAEVAAAIGHASLGPLVLGMLSALAFLGLRGWRWKLILDASAPNARVGDATAVTAVGFAVNAVAAFKVGEILRMAAIAPRAGIAVGEAGGTVVVERVLDVLALLVLAVGAAAFSGAAAAGAGLWGGVAAISGLFLAIGVVAFILASHPAPTLKAWSRLTSHLPLRMQQGAQDLAASVLRGFSALLSGRRLAAVVGLSFLVWIAAELGLYAYFRSLTTQLPAATLFLALVLFTVSQAVSITPGSVGTYEGFFLLVLTPFGAHPASLVTAVAILSHVAGILAYLFAGALGALWLRFASASAPVRSERPLPSQDRA
ncbi:MAG: flippase-like domain-containing protein [Chloroflexi bacterium]|nr:MAG: flippase-like domain-containing protein [Chloroflexota bacterium]